MNVNNYEDTTNQSQGSSKRKEITQIKAVKKYRRDLKDGIVGLKNNSLYCYMNACLQCLINIDPLRDYYLDQGYKRFHDDKTFSNSNDYSRSLTEFLDKVFQSSKDDRK